MASKEEVVVLGASDCLPGKPVKNCGTKDNKDYKFSFRKAAVALFKFFCCFCCCCSFWDDIMGFIYKIIRKIRNVITTIAIISTLYNDWYNAYIFASYRLSRLDLDEDTALNIANFFAIVIISGITVVVVLTKLYTKGAKGEKGKVGHEGDSVVHFHYLQHIMFARVIYIFFVWHHEPSTSSSAFLLVTTGANTLFGVLKYFLDSLDASNTGVVILLLHLIFSIMSFVLNILRVAISEIGDQKKETVNGRKPKPSRPTKNTPENRV